MKQQLKDDLVHLSNRMANPINVRRHSQQRNKEDLEAEILKLQMNHSLLRPFQRQFKAQPHTLNLNDNINLRMINSSNFSN